MRTPSERSRPPVVPGTVYLVGAGPGDPGLLTIRGSEVLGAATVVYHDHLVSDGVRAHCAADAQLVDVGKIGHGPQTAQQDIESRLIAAARAGHTAVRLKGGDPFIFGRGAEEALALRAAGIPFEIVPGVSSALAVPAAAGIPLTARGVAASVAIVTGHSLAGAPAPIPIADTIVVLMGVANAASIRDQLAATGLSPDTPAAAIEWGTYDRQRVLSCTLSDLPGAIAAHGIGAPAVLVIGDVVSLRNRLRQRETEGDAALPAAQACSFEE
ncbi:MAG TPA: uroporphyrinogen-III C-methyltransferase [Vicinamibacterales bacterium]|nr:uroporphyrinogen-III C-methyltransferase [Vicinamibacterales bacterium]